MRLIPIGGTLRLIAAGALLATALHNGALLLPDAAAMPGSTMVDRR